MIDWGVASATAHRFAAAGPEIGDSDARAVVEQLRTLAADATDPVREFTGLEAGAGTAPVLVIDRSGWADANIATFSEVMDPLLRRLDDAGASSVPLVRTVGGKVAGAEVGALLAFLSTKVLGQFDPFSGDAGRLFLVAPNIVEVERKLEVDPRDFRAWVCLHEETHRVQFTAVPWLGDHVRSLVEDAMAAVDVRPQAVSDLLGQAAGRLRQVLRGDESVSLSELFQNEKQREMAQQITGVMSLLEGHADVVMDGVGPQVVPSVDVIRRKFDQRRKGGRGIDRLIRSLLGLEAKMRQYRDGAAFVRAVVGRVGMEEFNAVWAEPAHLPTAEEILDPDRWVARVL